MVMRPAGAALLGCLLAAPAWAQVPVPNGLLLLGKGAGWAGTCPQGSAVLEEFNLAGIPLTVVDPVAWSTVNFRDYTMIFLEDCQDDPTYDAWNARMGELHQWVHSGGFLGVHATRGCYPNAAVQAQLPGPPPSRISAYASEGHNLQPNHPILANVGSPASGTALSHDEYTTTGDPYDTVLLSSTLSGNALLFEREIGHGVIIYGGLTYSYGQLTCGGGPPQDAGQILRNEVTYGATFTLCSLADADGDGTGDDCDACPGHDDDLDADRDDLPDACDACPELPEPSDVNQNGICDDLEDDDGDGVSDYDDACPGYDDSVDEDGDGVPDPCDNCPQTVNADQHDADEDGHGEVCDCADADASLRPGAEEHCDGVDEDCDGVIDGPDPVDGQDYWLDADEDGHGDLHIPAIRSCEPVPYRVTRGGDCHDGDPTIHPDADEVCDHVDQDCDGDPLGAECPREEPPPTGGCDSVPGAPRLLGIALAGLLALRRRRAA